MINIVHPKVTSKPPIYKPVQRKVDRDATVPSVAVRKMENTCYSIKEVENDNGDDSVTLDTQIEDFSNHFSALKKFNDCNQNIIEPSYSMEQVCYMSMDLDCNLGLNNVSKVSYLIKKLNYLNSVCKIN